MARGTVIDPVPVTGLAANFSPIPRSAPPPLGSEIAGVLFPLALLPFAPGSTPGAVDSEPSEEEGFW